MSAHRWRWQNATSNPIHREINEFLFCPIGVDHQKRDAAWVIAQ